MLLSKLIKAYANLTLPLILPLIRPFFFPLPSIFIIRASASAPPQVAMEFFQEAVDQWVPRTYAKLQI